MPGEIQKGKHAKTNWRKVVQIDVTKSADVAVWEEAFDATGIFEDTGSSQVSDLTESASEAPSAALTGYSGATESNVGEHTESDEDDDESTPTGRRSPSDLTETEIDYVESTRREKRERKQRRLPIRARASDKPGRHPARRPLSIRSKSSVEEESIAWPDLDLIGEAIAAEYSSDRAEGKAKGKGKPLKREMEKNEGGGFDKQPVISGAKFKRLVDDIGDFDWRYNERRRRLNQGDLHAAAHRRTRKEVDSETESGVASTVSVEDEEIGEYEDEFNEFQEDQSRQEPYWLYCQRMVAELFAASFPDDWPEEPVEQHIQTPRLLDQIQDPSSELSRVLYAAAAEAQLKESSDSEDETDAHTEHSTEPDTAGETEEETEDESEASSEEGKYFPGKYMPTISQVGSEAESSANLSDTLASIDRGKTMHSKHHGASRIMKKWLETLDRYRPEFDEAMRQQFSECRSDAERKELNFLLTRVAPPEAVLEHFTRAMLNPNYSEFAQPGTRGEKSLQELTDPEGRKGRARAMRDSQLSGLGREGDRPRRWNENPLNREGSPGWFIG